MGTLGDGGGQKGCQISIELIIVRSAVHVYTVDMHRFYLKKGQEEKTRIVTSDQEPNENKLYICVCLHCLQKPKKIREREVYEQSF